MTMMQGDMMKCYMMRMYEVKPECRDLWRMEFPKCKMMWEKHGAKCMGMWQVCLGGSCMYMMMMEFPNMMTAMKCQMGIRTDPDHMHMCQMMYKCVDKITCPIMKCMPMCPMTMPSPNSNICMMRFTMKTMPCMAMKDCQSFVTKFCEMFCKPCGMKMVGCFVPCMTMTCNSIYMMMEMPEEKTMDCMAKMEEFCMMCCADPAKCDMMMPFYNHCSSYSVKMMNPCCMNMGQMTMGMGQMKMGQMGMDQQMCGQMGGQQMCM